MSAILAFRPAPEPAAATLGDVIVAYLAHLALKLQLGQLSADHFANVSRSLNRFADAWRVVAGDGRQAMVRAEDAGCQTDALAKATALLGRSAGSLHPGRNRDWPLTRASSDDLTRWVLANPQWKTGWTRTNNLGAIVAAFGWYEEETGARTPYRRSRMPRFEKQSRREANASEYVALMRHTSSIALRRILWCLWNVQGCRTCEARELEWSDFRSGERDRPGDANFRWEAAYVCLDRHKTRRRTGRPKLIPLTRRQARFFAALWRQRPPGSRHVFLNTEGTPWDRHTFARHLRRTAKRIGLDDGAVSRVSAYCFRHAFATQADEAGVDRAKTAMLLGHSSPRMIETVYSKMDTKAEPMREAAEITEKARAKKRRQAKPKPPPAPPRSDQPELFD